MGRPTALDYVMSHDGAAVAAPTRGLNDMPLPQVL